MSAAIARLRLGTRGSELALRQARMVQDALAARARVEAEIVVVRTSGDDLSAGTQWRDDTPGLFTTEIEQALDRGDVDVAVHSLKDLPTVVWSGTLVAAVLERADPCDALVSAGHVPLEQLPPGARIGTSSLRRRAQVLEARPDVEVVDLRGNVPTRLSRVVPGELDAAVLAVAGLERLGRRDAISQVLAPDRFVPAPGQGAIAVQVHADDRRTLEALASITHEPTWRAVSAERACLAAIEGGCQAPVGAHARLEESGIMRLDAFVASLDGTQTMRESERVAIPDVEAAVALGRRVAARLLQREARGLWKS